MAKYRTHAEHLWLVLLCVLLGGIKCGDVVLTKSVGSVHNTPGKSALATNIGNAFVRSLTNAIPALKSLPNLADLKTGGGMKTFGIPMDPQLSAALEEFSAPLVRFAHGGQPLESDIRQILQSIPALIVNVPGFGDVDVKQLDPSVVSYILRGGQIPGIPKEATDALLRGYMLKMVKAAEAASKGTITPEQQKFLPPLDQLPAELVNKAMSGINLPGLSGEQTDIIKLYYLQPRKPHTDTNVVPAADLPGANIGAELLKILPKNYNISKIPIEVIQKIAQGEIPDLRLLPLDLQDHIRANAEKIITAIARTNTKNLTIDDLLAKLPTFQRANLETFDAYELTEIKHELQQAELEAERVRKVQLYTCVALSILAVITFVVLGGLYVYMKRRIPNHTSYHPGSPNALKATPNQKRHRILSSTRIAKVDN
ncbi:unnamed protein product, partial [Mesorhabditis spiculigera]